MAPPLAVVAGAAILTIIAVKLFLWLYQFIVMRQKLMKFEGEPHHWLWGHVNQQFSDPGEDLVKFLIRCTEKFKGRPFRSMLGPFAIGCVLANPDDVQTILKSSEPKTELSYRLVRPWLGDGLLLAGGKRWQRNRRLLTPAFHFELLRPYVKVYRECANTMLDLWSEAAEKGDPVEVSKYLSHMSFDVLLQCIFSYKSDIQTGTQSPYIDAVYKLSELVMERILYPPHHFNLIYSLSRSGWRFRKANRVVHEFSQRVIAERRKALENKDTSDGIRTRKYLDFLDILIEAKDDHGIGLTDSEIRDEVDTFMFAGHDTTSSGISWSLYCLAKYPQYQQMCRDEVEEILSNGKTELEWDDLNSLVFTTQFIKETLRLFPPVSSVHRDVTRDIQLRDAVFPKGAWVSIDIFSLHHNPLVWDNPEEFRPSRFSSENSKGRHPFAYIPFSAGPRNCIGQNFALNEERVAIAMTVYRYELIEVPDHPIERWINGILKARYGIKIQFKPIKR